MREVNWTKVSAIAEISSTAVIVVTLIYLVIQTQQNFTALQANSRQVSISSDLQVIQTSLASRGGIELLKFKDELTNEEAAMLEGWLVMLVRSREHEWLQYRAGLLDRRTWESYLSGLLGNLSTPNTRRWWNVIESSFDAEFAAVIDDRLATVPIDGEFHNRFGERVGEAQ
jgi:hypothetical protein